MKKHPRIFSAPWSDYELIDAGNELKLERWGEVVTIRPDRQAYFDPQMPMSAWKEKAHWSFHEEKNQSGNWKKLKNNAPDQWQIGFKGLNFKLELTAFKHLGLFPEQSCNWEFINSTLKKGQKFLNLFAYTGASSIVARKVGAEVTHCDSIKQLVDWSNENQQLSELEGIRWVLDDALTFAREK